MKRLFAILTAICILLSITTATAHNDYATRGEVCQMLLEAADFYNTGVAKGDILKGYDDGLLHEERPVTRAEALVMLKRAFGNIPEPVGHNRRIALKKEDFNDIPQWAIQEIAPLFDSGIVAGTNSGTFTPDAKVTKAQMQLFIKRVYSLFATNIKDDFYATVNKNHLEKMELKDGEYITGTIYELQNNASAQMNDIIEEIAAAQHKKGTPKQKIADMYSCIIDVKSRNKNGVAPIEEYLDKIDSVRNISELSLIQTLLSKELCVNPFMQFSLTVDLEDSTKYMLYFETMSPVMNKDIYMQNDSREKSAYIEYLKTLLVLSGEREEEAHSDALAFFEFEKKLAENMLSADEENDIKKIYNTYSYNKLCAMFPDFDMNDVIAQCGLKKDEEILIADVKITEKFASLYNQSAIDELKTAAKIALLITWGETLNEEFCKAAYKLDSEILGVSGEYQTKQDASFSVQNIMADYLGEIYSQKYFDESSKKDVENMAHDIISVFKERIDSLSWMSDKAKQQAKRKLDSMSIKIGYPEIAESYLDNVDIASPKQGGTYFKNALLIQKESIKHYAALQGQTVNRDAWAIFPYTVNACYDPTANDITFPAAILQAPLYQKNASYEENLGGIGYIIAHEITHAFDENGALFDEYGNLGTWWNKEDYSEFSLLCEKVVQFYNGQEAIPAIPTNGKLTLSENVADLGGAMCVSYLAKSKGADLALLYTSMAKAWASTKTREYALLAANTDNHSDDKLRINHVLANIDEFYEAFGISEGDGMFVAPENRIKVW